MKWGVLPLIPLFFAGCAGTDRMVRMSGGAVTVCNSRAAVLY